MAVEKEKKGKGKVHWRWKWKRVVTVFVVGYLAFWSIESGLHMWVLSHDEATLVHHIQVVQSHNAQLNQDIRELHNPSLLKKMITGKMPVPNPNKP